jgi:hypothetical protein
MPGFMPGIHEFFREMEAKTWMAGTCLREAALNPGVAFARALRFGEGRQARP